MGSTALNVVIVLALIIIEALFVAAELALISLRESQVQTMATAGRRGAAVARLVADPNRFLATVQIGVTLTALGSSAYGAVTLADTAKRWLVRLGWGDTVAVVVGFIAVTVIISFVTLVIGELVPKRLALQRAEGTARLLSPLLNRISTACRPVIWLASRCTDALVRLLGGDPRTRSAPITEDELRGLVAAHESLTADERHLIDEVFAAGERGVSEVMVPRTEVAFLDAAMTVRAASELVAGSPHSRYPVVGAGQDDITGFVHIRDLLAAMASADSRRTVGELSRPVKRLPGSKNVLAALSELRREGHQLAIVVDEYGGTDGIVTFEDLVEEIIGEIRDEYDEAPAAVRRLAGGAVELDGLANLDEVAELTGLELPAGPYETAAGYVMAALGRLPQLGDEVRAGEHTISVIEVDGRRA
ncbi:MAG: hemolysin family protein, partial [Actinomycetia bacterium]|nr:hemolysin family protein [Actinomycetes bacterium]